MIPLLATFLRPSVSPRRGTACRARSWLRFFLGFLCALCCLCALGSSLSRRYSPELEGAPPLVCKGGLLRPDVTNSLLFVLAEAQP
jgi:hypothetical protein